MMINVRLKTLILLLCCWIYPADTWAGNAGMLLSPTRIVFEDGKRYATLVVRNNGDATGRYKIEIVDTNMDEDGGIRIRSDEDKDEFSAKDMISLSPRSMTLKADDNQSIRILIKYRPDLPDGEYRSHILVKMTETNLDPEITPMHHEGTAIALQTKITTVIPVIIRKGQTSFKVTLDEAKLVTAGGDSKKTPEVNVSMGYAGNQSLIADIKVTHLASDGKESQLAFLRGVVIYRNLTKRRQSIGLAVPEDVNIHSGHLRIDLLTPESEGSHVLAKKEISP